MMNTFLIILICGATSTLASQYETTVLAQQGTKYYIDSFDTGAESFIDMLRNNKLFVDNSLFIKEALTAPQSLYMLGPRKSGKTINLDMLKTFLEIQVDDQGRRILPKNTTSNYRLFVNGEVTMDDGSIKKLDKPLLISKHKDLIERYLGEYPVIYINFKEVKEGNPMDFLYGIECCIKRTYEQHKYMINAFRNALRRTDLNSTTRQGIRDDWKRFENILDFKEIHDFLAIRILVLCRILHKHFNKMPIILYEDFDRLLSNLFLVNKFVQNYLTKIDCNMSPFQTWVFTQNDCFEKGFVMETIKPLQCPFGAWENYTLIDTLLDNHPISRYFGFDRDKVQTLFDKHNLLANESSQAHQWYGRFKYNQYSPYSVVSFLTSRKFVNYFRDEDVEKILHPLLLHHIEIRNSLLSFLSNQTRKTTVAEIQREIDPIDLCKLAPQIFDMKRPYDDDANNRFTWLLIRKGYLNVRNLNELDIIESEFDEKIEISLPNKEIAAAMSNWLLSFYQHNYTIDNGLLLNAASNLLQFVNKPDSAISLLENSLIELFHKSGCAPRYNATNVPLPFYRKVEDPYRALFTCAALKMQQMVSFDLQVTYNQFNKLDYVIYNSTSSKALILQITHEPELNVMPEMYKRRPDIIQKLNYPTTISSFIIRIFPDETVRIVVVPNKT